MRWNEEQALTEFAWLRLMSRMKYDGYQDFLAGMRFIESLAAWLQQFQADERQAAYALLRKKLVFIGHAELNHLVELFYPETVQPRLMRHVSETYRKSPIPYLGRQAQRRSYTKPFSARLFSLS